MKHKISLSSLFLFVTTMALLVVATITSLTIRTSAALLQYQLGFYTHNAESHYAFQEFDPQSLLTAIHQLPAKGFVIYKEQLDFTSDSRGVYFHPEATPPPLLQGRFFTQEEMQTNARVALIGKMYQNEIYQKNGTDTIAIAGEEFTVIGILGFTQSTSLDIMKWIPLDTALQLNGIYGPYTIDAANRSQLKLVAEVVNPIIFNSPNASNAYAIRDNLTIGQKINKFLLQINNAAKIYSLVMASFLISTVFAVQQWLKARQAAIFVGNLLGFSKWQLFVSFASSSGKIVLGAALPAIAALYWLQWAQKITPPTLGDIALAVFALLLLFAISLYTQLSLLLAKSQTTGKGGRL